MTTLGGLEVTTTSGSVCRPGSPEIGSMTRKGAAAAGARLAWLMVICWGWMLGLVREMHSAASGGGLPCRYLEQFAGREGLAPHTGKRWSAFSGLMALEGDIPP